MAPVSECLPTCHAALAICLLVSQPPSFGVSPMCGSHFYRIIQRATRGTKKIEVNHNLHGGAPQRAIRRLPPTFLPLSGRGGGCRGGLPDPNIYGVQ